jgi:2-polyprenyl-3-methyl-5-hydroxy-6-metoxy-1,4-benzoquinol methylase
MRVLVTIANYGRKNDQYLQRILEEYRKLPFQIKLIVLSNVAKDLGSDVKVTVGMPGKNPHSLPFGHKKIFGDGVNDFDLFIYTEDDILITHRNIEAFLRLSPFLAPDELAGFIHYELDDQGEVYYDPPHGHFHWDPSSVCTRGEYVFAQHTNEHSACFALTQPQLRSAIASGGFLVPPHEGRYNLATSASTDPYTQCGFRKMVCISHLDDISVRHLPANKWKEHPYRHWSVFQRQVKELLLLQENGRPRELLFPVETRLRYGIWSKDYYEPRRDDILALIPSSTRSVLSVGCSWGETEVALLHRGLRVVGVPLDPVIGACAEERGIEIVCGSFSDVRSRLSNQRFDCLLLSNVVHLVPDPAGILGMFSDLLTPRGTVLASVPNCAEFGAAVRRVLRHPTYRVVGRYQRAGMHASSPSAIRKWFAQAGLAVDRLVQFVPPENQGRRCLSLGVFDRWLATDLIAIGTSTRDFREKYSEQSSVGQKTTIAEAQQPERFFKW